MADIHPSRTRLRRKFHYPDSDSEPVALDDQEQESLIAQLSTANASQNTLYRNALAILVALAALPFLPLLFSRVSILALSSLAATAYLLVRLPPTRTGLRHLDDFAARDKAARSRIPSNYPPLGPLDTYLPYLNLLLSGLIVLMSITSISASGEWYFVVLASLPASIYAVTIAAKVTMAQVDPDKELSPLQYQYRGA
ncbi:hypothetical protein CDD81_5125 [Ophiocordyceps australis]|uniref:Uncharacterized protein n=1 Tax=Ophiocordyceps australis TaxID=1399860 RepID=A0A2C5Y999_9HYPO|nr:hypothetical protein CDD81_5125 [Ophiocordyceps australis]